MSIAVETEKVKAGKKSIKDVVSNVRDDILGLERQLVEAKQRFDLAGIDDKKKYKESIEGHVYEIWSKLTQSYRSSMSLSEAREFYGLSPYKV